MADSSYFMSVMYVPPMVVSAKAAGEAINLLLYNNINNLIVRILDLNIAFIFK
jgi:hypothetical protein